jgi:hypothetical protein
MGTRRGKLPHSGGVTLDAQSLASQESRRKGYMSYFETGPFFIAIRAVSHLDTYLGECQMFLLLVQMGLEDKFNDET